MEIRMPAELYDEWFDAYKKYLKQRYTDIRQLPPLDTTRRLENFIFKGVTFLRVDMK
jgi:hypothetical protein